MGQRSTYSSMSGPLSFRPRGMTDIGLNETNANYSEERADLKAAQLHRKE